MSTTPTVAIHDRFLDCLLQLPKSVSSRASDFVMKFRAAPERQRTQLEKIQGVQDPRMFSARVTDDYRAIVYRPQGENVYLLLYLDKHDDAYAWAERRTCEVNSASGALQVYRTDEIDVTSQAPTSETYENKPASLLKDWKDADLANIGVPARWLSAVRDCRDDGDVEQLGSVLPADAYDAVVMAAAGYKIEDIRDELDLNKPADDDVSVEAALTSPQSQRSFWVAEDEEELQRMLDAPMEKWRVFLHPTQRKLVNRHWNGPIRVLGGAGTGKTVCAMHRARWLAENVATTAPERVLVTTFTRNLAADIQANLRRLCDADTLTRIEVTNLDHWVWGVLKQSGLESRLVYPDGPNEEVDNLWEEVIHETDTSYPKRFLQEEWKNVVQGNAVTTRQEYLKADRRGRGRPLNRRERIDLWQIFAIYRERLNDEGLMEPDDAYREVRKMIGNGTLDIGYRAVVVDEAQDMGPEAFRLIASLAPTDGDKHAADSLFITGDAHQRIYGRSVTLSRCGINVRGRRSQKLRINYRTPEEIRAWAVRIVEEDDIDDLDGGEDRLEDHVHRSLFRGQRPTIKSCESNQKEVAYVTETLSVLTRGDGARYRPKDVCVVARTHRLLEQWSQKLTDAGFPVYRLPFNKPEDRDQEGIRLATMHRVKGLEFDCMILVDANEDVIPPKPMLDQAEDQVARDGVWQQERALLHVTATRAKREFYLVSAGKVSNVVSSTTYD